MTSKEALKRLLFLARECNYEVREHRNSYCDMLEKVVQQDLDRLEQLEKIFSDSHICEIKARFNELECGADKCENCPLGIGEDICLKQTFEYKWKLQKERYKLKKIINYLKPHTYLASGLCEIKLVDEKVSKITPKYHNGKEVYEPKYNEFYELLTEVFENE